MQSTTRTEVEMLQSTVVNTPASSDYIQEIGHGIAHKDHVQTKWQAARAKPMSVFWCFFGLLTLITSSFDQSAALVVLGIPAFRRDFGVLFGEVYVIDANWLAIMSGAPLAASALGAFVAGLISDKLGRKRSMSGGLAITFVGVAIEYVATTIQVFFAGKFVNGFALGILIPITVAYLSEIAPLALRGWLTSLANVAFSVGALACYLIAANTGTRLDRWAYRGVFIAQWGFGTVAIILSVFAPDSPLSLVAAGKDAAALKSLRQLGDSEHDAEGHLASIKTTLKLASEAESSVTWFDCFKGTNLRRTIICIGPVLAQGFVGLIFVNGYATYYFQLAGIPVQKSFDYTVAIYVLSLGGNIIGISSVDRIGRRPLLVWGTLALAIVLLIAGICGCFPTNQSAVKGVVAMILLWGFICSATLGSALFAMIPETPTSTLRTKTAAIVVVIQGATFTMWSFILPYMINPDRANLGAKTFFVFGGFSVLTFIYFFLYQTETANRTFEEIDEMFHKRVPARKFKEYVTEAEEKSKAAVTVHEDKLEQDDIPAKLVAHAEHAVSGNYQ